MLFAGLAVRIDRLQPCPAVAEAIRRHSTGTPRVAQFGYFRPSLVYYSDARVETCRNARRVADFLDVPTMVLSSPPSNISLAWRLNCPAT